MDIKNILNYLKYSGLNVIIKFNPYHWRLSASYLKTNEVWEQDALVVELFPITVRLWIDNGEW